MASLETKKKRSERYLWKLGNFDASGQEVDKEFMDIKGSEHFYRISDDWSSTATFEIPKVLAGDPNSGCVKLILEFTIEKGSYVFIRRFLEPRETICCVVSFDENELDVYYTGSSYDEEGSLKQDIQECRYPFLCLDSGYHKITLSMERVMNKNRSVRIDALALTPYQVQPQSHSLKKEVPGQVCLDAWGWMGCISFTRRVGQRGEEVILLEKDPPEDRYNLKLDTPVDLEYFKRRVVDESYKRGANFMQVCPYLNLWKRIEKGTSYAERNPTGKNEDWEDGKDLELIQYAHHRGMIMDDHHNFVAECQEARDIAACELHCLREKAKGFHNLIDGHWSKVLDGFESEGVELVDSPQGMVSLYQTLWEYDPGCYVNECGSRWGTWRWSPPPKNSPWQRIKGPSFIQTIMGANDIGLRLGSMAGYDDKIPLSPFLEHSELSNEYGKKFLAYQADSRRFSTLVCGGGSAPDWILKQANDFFRPRYKDPDDAYELCIWWLGESETVCPDEVKDYVYAVTQDPIKCAVATNLAATGLAGKLEQRRHIYQTEATLRGEDLSGSLLWKLNRRSSFPHDTWFIQNNYLRVLLDPRKEGEVLLYDTERTAHYDSNSLSYPLSSPLLNTQGLKKAKVYEKKYRVIKPGGYLSILELAMRMGLEKKSLKEMRRYTIINDTPYLCISLEREAQDTLPQINTIFGCEGYDTLIVGGKKYQSKTSFSGKDLPEILRFQDSSSLKEDMVLLIIDKGLIEEMNWEPEKFILTSTKVKKETLKLAVAIPTDLYSQNELKELRQFLSEPEERIASSSLPRVIKNKYPLPLVKVVEITEPSEDPYLVKEYGWWVFRGAQSTLLRKEPDYLKLYLPPQGKALIQQYGFIKGAVKPGWGCQYTLAIKDVSLNKEKVRCTVKVLNVTPYIFAPRLEFSGKINRVKLDGKSWHYFEDSFLFLPNRKGIYEIEVFLGKETISPHLIRTAALIEETSWKGKVFTFKASLPVWVKKLPEGLKFSALIHLPPNNDEVKKIEGAEMVKKGSNGLLVRFAPDSVRIYF